MMICPSCGASVPDQADFCPNCGASMRQGTSASYNNPNTTNYGANPMQPTAPITQKDIAVSIILTIITCGIYGYYWLYTQDSDLQTLLPRPGATSSGMVVLYSLITCGIYHYYWMYKAGEMIDQCKNQRGVPSSNSGILYLVLSLVGLAIVSHALIQNELNNYAQQ